jgi:hypothetical protein
MLLWLLQVHLMIAGAAAASSSPRPSQFFGDFTASHWEMAAGHLDVADVPQMPQSSRSLLAREVYLAPVQVVDTSQHRRTQLGLKFDDHAAETMRAPEPAAVPPASKAAAPSANRRLLFTDESVLLDVPTDGWQHPPPAEQQSMDSSTGVTKAMVFPHDFNEGGTKLHAAVTSDAAVSRTAAEMTIKCTNVTDCTEPLQRALDDPAARRIIVPRQPVVWQTRPLLLNRSNVELRLEPGVVLQARRGFFHGRSACLLRIGDAHNITISGAGAFMRMWRVDYCNEKLYSKAEWRSGIEVFDSHNVSISGVSIAETGGDGILLDNCTGCLVRNVTTSGAFRNGMSVISAVDLLVEGCLFSQTGAKGRWNGGDTLTTKNGSTAPSAGVDIEPDYGYQRLTNITFRRCTAIGNRDDGFDISAKQLATPLSITFEDCVARDCAGSWGTGFAFMELAGPGNVTLHNCSAENMGGAGLAIRNKHMNATSAHTTLTVQKFSARNVGRLWGNEMFGKEQGFYPITLSDLNPLPNRITLRDVAVHAGGGVAARSGRPFIGCENATMTNGFAIGPCIPSQITALEGDVSVFAANESVCSKRALGAAGAKLHVTCHSEQATPPNYMFASAKALKSDDCNAHTLEGLCGGARRSSMGHCLVCLAKHIPALACDAAEQDAFCSGQPGRPLAARPFRLYPARDNPLRNPVQVAVDVKVIFICPPCRFR